MRVCDWELSSCVPFRFLQEISKKTPACNIDCCQLAGGCAVDDAVVFLVW
jgi:hypothetical protein